MKDDSYSAFLFSKHAKIVEVHFYEQARVEASVKFVQAIQERVYEPGTRNVKTRYDFTKFFDPVGH